MKLIDELRLAEERIRNRRDEAMRELGAAKGHAQRWMHRHRFIAAGMLLALLVGMCVVIYLINRPH